MKKEELADHLNRTSIFFREEPFQLRAGGESQHYLDLRRGLAVGRVMAPAARFMVECAGLEVVTEPTESPDRVAAGIGIAGRALATAHALAFPYAFLWTHGNDDETDKDLMNGYGFHGATVAGRRVFGVDEIATTGDSLCTLVEMVQEAGGELECAAVLVDRSKGLAAEALGELGVRLNIVFEFDEEAGLIVPAGVNA